MALPGISSTPSWRVRLAQLGGLHGVHPIHGAGILRVRGEAGLAVQALYELLEREPHHIDGLNTIIAILSSLGRREEVRELRRRILELRCAALGLEEHERPAAVAYFEAAIGAVPPPRRMPACLVRTTFDQLSEGYDVRMRQWLGYRAPELVHEAVLATADGRTHGLEVLELGCGTGLLAPLLRTSAARLVGVDLSAGMLRRISDPDIYDELQTAEIVAWLEANRRRFELVVAADVLCYFGDLASLVELVASRLASRGRFVFTVERSEEVEVDLCPTERYAHSEGHLRRVAAASKLEVRYLVRRALRAQHGRPVEGFVVVLQRPQVAKA